MNAMIERLESITARYNELGELLLQPETLSDNRLMAKLAKEQASLTQVVETYTEYKAVVQGLEDAKELLHEDDEEMREMAKMEIEELEPRLFSFNNPYGACPECHGLGMKNRIEPSLIIKNPDWSIRQGAMMVTGWNLDVGSFTKTYFTALAKRYNFSLRNHYLFR